MDAKRAEVFADEARRKLRRARTKMAAGSVLTRQATSVGNLDASPSTSALEASPSGIFGDAVASELSELQPTAVQSAAAVQRAIQSLGRDWWHHPLVGSTWAEPLIHKVRAVSLLSRRAKIAAETAAAGRKTTPEEIKARIRRALGRLPVRTAAELHAADLLECDSLEQALRHASTMSRYQFGLACEQLERIAPGGPEAVALLFRAMSPVPACFYLFRMRDLHHPPMPAATRKQIFAALGPRLQQCLAVVSNAVNDASLKRSAEVGTQLRVFASRHALTTAQLDKLLSVLTHESERLAAVATLWSRVSDPEALRPLLSAMPLYQQQQLMQQLGFMHVFDRLGGRPEGLYFRLGMDEPEEAELAQLLVKRAVKPAGGGGAGGKKAAKRGASPSKRPATAPAGKKPAAADASTKGGKSPGKERPATAKPGKGKDAAKAAAEASPPRTLRGLRVNGELWAPPESPGLWEELTAETRDGLQWLEFEYAPDWEEQLARKGDSAAQRITYAFRAYLERRNAVDAVLKAAAVGLSGGGGRAAPAAAAVADPLAGSSSAPQQPAVATDGEGSGADSCGEPPSNASPSRPADVPELATAQPYEPVSRRINSVIEESEAESGLGSGTEFLPDPLESAATSAVAPGGDAAESAQPR